MVQIRKKCGFSTLEVIVAVAILLILATLVLGVGKRVKQQASIKLAQSMIDVLVTALEQYYDDTGQFPIYTDFDYNDDPVTVTIETLLGGTLSAGAEITAYESSEMLFYYLNSRPNSKKIADAISDSLITAGDPDLTVEFREININAATQDLLRYVGPWYKKTSMPDDNVLHYRYGTNDTFPLLEIETPSGNIISNR